MEWGHNPSVSLRYLGLRTKKNPFKWQEAYVNLHACLDNIRPTREQDHQRL